MFSSCRDHSTSFRNFRTALSAQNVIQLSWTSFSLSLKNSIVEILVLFSQISSGNAISGSTITYADVTWFQFLCDYLDGGGYAGEKEAVAAVLPALPRMKAAMDAVAAHPQVWFLKTFFAKVWKILAGSFSAVSKRNCARKYAFDSIFQALQDLHPFASLQSQNFRKKSVWKISIFHENSATFANFAKFAEYCQISKNSAW